MAKTIPFQKGPSLYEMTEDMKAVLEDMDLWAEDHEGDLTEYPLERLDKLETDLKKKVLKCAVMYKEWRDMGKAIELQEKAAAARRKVHTNRGERLKKYMESCLPPNAKFEDDVSAVSWKSNPPAVEVLAPIAVMPELFLRRADPEVDKAELKARMLPYEVPVTNDLGEQLFDTEKQPMMRTELQVRWPKQVLEVQDAPLAADGEDDDLFPAAAEVPAEPPAVDLKDLDKVNILARMVQGRSLKIT